MNQNIEGGCNVESKEVSEPTRQFVYEQVADLKPKNKEPYTAESLFGQNEYKLSDEQLSNIFKIYAYDENALSSKLGELGKTTEGRDKIISSLRDALAQNDSRYQDTVKDGVEMGDYSYPDLLTDATSYKGERVKKKLFAELLAKGDIQEILDPILAAIAEYEEMEMEVDADTLSEIIHTVYGIEPTDELIPQNVREAIEALV